MSENISFNFPERPERLNNSETMHYVTSKNIKARVDSLGNAILREQGKLPPVIQASPGKSLEEVSELLRRTNALWQSCIDEKYALLVKVDSLKATIDDRDKEINDLKNLPKYSEGYEDGFKSGYAEANP